MDKVLSQDEVDALLTGITKGDVDTDQKETDPSEAKLFDLGRQEKIIRGRMPSLEIIHEKFSRLYQATLGASLRKVVSISMTSVETVKFDSFLRSVPLPTSITICKLEPLRGFSLFIVDASLAFMLIEQYFGGKGQGHFKIEGRDFTHIEMKVIKKVVSMAFSDLEEAWKSVHEVKFQYSRSEMNPQFATIVSPTEVVVVITFELKIDTLSGIMRICIPYAAIEPIKEKLNAGFQSDSLAVDRRWMERFLGGLQYSQVRVDVELGKGEITVQDLLRFVPGDVIILENSVVDDLVAYVEGVPKFKGKPGFYKGSQAFKVTSRMDI